MDWVGANWYSKAIDLSNRNCMYIAQSNARFPATSTAPAITPYQSIQARSVSHGHSQGHSSTFNIFSQPGFAPPTGTQSRFQDTRSLGVGAAARQIANQQRRASAAATLPRHPSLQVRTSRRGRGSAIAPPGITAPPAMRDTVVVNDDGSVSIRVKVKVYPPTEVS